MEPTYEWGVHVAVYADKAGLDTAQVRSLAVGRPDDPCWTSEADRALLATVDQLHDTHDLEDPTWAALIAAVGEDGALDVLLVSGWTTRSPTPSAPSGYRPSHTPRPSPNQQGDAKPTLTRDLCRADRADPWHS